MTMHVLSRVFVAAALVLAIPVAVTPAGAAGSHDKMHGGGSGPNTGKPGKAADATRTIKIVMHDNYYEPESLNLKEGETARMPVSLSMSSA